MQMKKLLLIVGLLSQVTICSDLAYLDSQRIKGLANLGLAHVAQQLDDLNLLLEHQQAAQTVKVDAGQNLKDLIKVLEQRFVTTVKLFEDEELSPEDVLTVAQELYDASCPPLLAHLYGQK